MALQRENPDGEEEKKEVKRPRKRPKKVRFKQSRSMSSLIGRIDSDPSFNNKELNDNRDISSGYLSSHSTHKTEALAALFGQEPNSDSVWV